MIENDLLDATDSPVVSESYAAASDQHGLKLKSQATVQNLDRANTKSLTNQKAQSVFCLSQEDDFDDDLSDEILFNQVDQLATSFSDNQYAKVNCDVQQINFSPTSKSSMSPLDARLHCMKPDPVLTLSGSAMVSSCLQNADSINTCRISKQGSNTKVAARDFTVASTSHRSNMAAKGDCQCLNFIYFKFYFGLLVFFS